MAVPAIAAGTTLQVIGQMESNRRQAELERLNAQFLLEQAEFSNLSTAREEIIFQDELSELQGRQVGVFAKANVDLSGSAFNKLAQTTAKGIDELRAIQAQGAQNTRLAVLRAQSSLRKAQTLSDPTLNALQAGGTILTGAASFA